VFPLVVLEATVHSSSVNGSLRRLEALQRELAVLIPGSRAAHGERPLELPATGIDAPRVLGATVIEGSAMLARPVDPPTAGFRAFLDGTQHSQVVLHVGNVPVVSGQVSAVIRERRDRRMHTWGAPLVEHHLYASRRSMPAVTWNTLLEHSGHELVDVSDAEGDLAHPFAVRDAAYVRVQKHREKLEQRLAEKWLANLQDPLFIDGGISGSDNVAVARCTVGVVKTHRTLYADGTALDVVLGLGERERSSVFRIAPSKRSPVASWYLRMRDPIGHDPMWGLVRVEIAYPSADALAQVSDRADEVSRWILAEVSPLALPDSRWDKMVYGIRDCEEFLRATV
jgi:hypothetical protein